MAFREPISIYSQILKSGSSNFFFKCPQFTKVYWHIFFKIMTLVNISYYLISLTQNVHPKPTYKLLFSCHKSKKSLNIYWFILLACDCAGANKVCNPTTGQCECPPNTAGRRCDRCLTFAWGLDEVTGCKVRDVMIYKALLLLTKTYYVIKHNEFWSAVEVIKFWCLWDT